MNEDNFSEIPNDAIVLLGKLGITNDTVDEIVRTYATNFSYDFHKGLVKRMIFSDEDDHKQWLNEGFPSQIIEPGSVWKKGRLRLRIVVEFILEGEGGELPDQTIEPSLDEFRE